jgi:hypothetical protein
MDDLESLFHQERASRREQELQMARVLEELQNQRQFTQNARIFYESAEYQGYLYQNSQI